jgi:hypothetical protein
MSSIAYKKLFSVNFAHNFYASGFSKEFSISPTVKTRAKIQDQRLVLRQLATGMKLFYRSVSQADPTPFLPIDNGVYSFALTLKNKLEFINVTELDESPSNKYSAGKILYIRNTTTTTNGISTELLNRLMPEQFTYDFAIASPVNVKIKILDYSGATVYTSPIALVPDDTGTRFHVPVDLSISGPGKYTIETYNNNFGTLVSSEEMYVDSSLIGKDVFGILDIELKTTMSFTFADFTALDAFATGFTRRLTRWKYFIINRSKRISSFTTSATFTITDTQLLPYNATVYNVLYTFGSRVVESPINGMETVSITSDVSNLIPFFEESEPNFKLAVNTTALVVSGLQNPTRQAVSADPSDYSITNIFIYI